MATPDIGKPFRRSDYVQAGFSKQSGRECGIKNDCPDKEFDPGLGGAALLREQSPDDE